MNPPGALVRRLARVAALFADRGAGARLERDPDRHGRAVSDEPPAPGRRGLGQDGRRRARRPHRRSRPGYQAAFMAPTEILAEQHLMTLRTAPRAARRARGAPHERASRARRGRSRRGGRERRGRLRRRHPRARAGRRARSGGSGLAVIDEQHRFGVAQRAALRGKGERPDVLVMTATPIPRTLALTLYGDLDVSVLDELPPGRRPIVTVARTGSKRRADLRFPARADRRRGGRSYVVLPARGGVRSRLRSAAATEMAERLQREVFPDRRVGLLHGRHELPPTRSA